MQPLKGWRRQLPVIAVLCCGTLVSILIFASIRSLEAEKARAAFQRAAQERFDDLQSELDLTVGKVVALGAFCESSYPVTHSSFDSFVTPLLSGRDAGIQALEWVPRVNLHDRAAFENSARRSGLSGYEIRDRLTTGELVRAGDRPYYFPVLYVRPYPGNEVAVGYDDLANNHSRREFFQRAAYTGELTASPRIHLVQETPDQYGILVIHPIYRHTSSVLDRSQLLGFAEGVLRIGDVVEKRGTDSGVDLVLTDLSTSTPGQQLYPAPNKQQPLDSALTQYRKITVGGRNWQLAAFPAPDAFPVSNTYSDASGAFSMLMTLLVAGYGAELLDRRRQVERLVEERTKALNNALTSLGEVYRGLEESEAKYRRLAEDSPDAIIVEREGTIVFVNRAAVQLFELDAAREGNYSMVEFVAPERRETAKKLFQDLYSHETQIAPQETRMVRRDGTIFDAEISASSFSYEGVRSFQIVLRDITQRKRDQAENARLILAIEQVEESIVITDPDGKIVYVNPAFERITGYSRGEALGKNTRILQSGRQSSEFYGELWKTLKDGESWNGRFLNRAKDGRLFTEEATISPVADSNGEIINYVAVKRDVTAETELQERLHHSQKMDAIGRLAGGVAHDFNNMLMVIVSYADMIESSLPNDDPLRKYVGQIMNAAQRSAALTHQLLAFSRKQVLAPQILNCNAILSETSSMIRRIISENIDLRCDLAPQLWNVKADADQMGQVILNLCVNARDAMPNGGSLILSTRNLYLDAGFVEISVSDTGVGISPEIQGKLFEPFFTTKPKGKGTGLGLATVYGIVQQSGGSVRVDSVPGCGATFTIQLPRCTEDATTPNSPAKKHSLAGRSLILLVEDQDAVREALASHLRDHGYRVLTASDGIQALDVLAQKPDISILISDLIMPRMGGRELVNHAARQNPGLRVIFMSGYPDHDFSDEQDSFGSPVVFLQKPFKMEALLSRIADLERPDVLPV